MRLDFRNSTFQIVIALLAGLGLGLVYSWIISPVTYVDANPSILRTDFKDQYRNVIAASYTSTHDLARARARLALLGDADSVGELSAQAQRMLASGEPFDRVRPLAQLATDLQQGFTSVAATNTPFSEIVKTSTLETPLTDAPLATETPPFIEPTISFEQTPFVPQPSLVTPTSRPTFTPSAAPGAPFSLVGQDTICDTSLKNGLLQVMLMDSRRNQVPGIKIIVTWDQGEDHFFTGLKPELGNGYADFIMKEKTVYSVRVVDGGSFVPNISAPTCTDPNGGTYIGGLLLTFQQP